MLGKVFRNFTNLKMRMYPHEYFITQGKGIERPFTGSYWWVKDIGDYHCVVCDQNLFPSNYKFFPTTGIASFFASHDKATKLENDEVQCSSCQSHLGHISDDGPAPTYKNLQIKSGALKFKPTPWFTLPPTRKEQKAERRKKAPKTTKEVNK